jgi:hypothetical protein
MLDNKQAKALLQRSLFSYAFEILWQSALLTAALSLTNYLLTPKTFDFEIVWITFVVVTVFNSIFTFAGLLMAAARYRNRFEDKDDD